MDIKTNHDVTDRPEIDEETLSEEDILETDGQLALAAAPAENAEENPPVTREQRRSRRKREIRARTISVKRMTKRELEIGRMLYPETDYYKPRARAECY